jgi:hypothetical protein
MNHPRRLVAMAAYLAETEDVFGDWQLERRGPLRKLHPDDEADLVNAAAENLVPFAGDFAGGLLVLDVSSGDVERAPVVSFDSEGGITVLGESFDDFLALLASDKPDAMEDSWTASPPLLGWIREQGVMPHASATNRLLELGEVTRRFWIAWTAELRAASVRLRPEEAVEHVLVLGERIGDVFLGMNRDVLDAKWGTPEIPAWGGSELGAIALYPQCPVVVALAQERVSRVTLYQGRHRAQTADGADPMFMRATDAMAWLESLGLAATRERAAIMVPSLGVRLSLCNPAGAGTGEAWVEAIEMARPPAADPQAAS